MNAIVLLKPYLLENRIKILLGVACLIAVDILQLCIPRIIKWAIDDLTVLRGTGRSMATYALYILAAAVAIGLLRYVWRRCLIGTSRRVEEGLRNRLFVHVQRLSAAYFDTVTTGDLMARATNDLQNIRMATGMGIVALTDALVLGTTSIAFMAYIDVTLTAFVLIPMPLIVLGTRVFSRRLHRRYLSVQGAFSDLTETVRERLAGIRMIKAHNMAHDASAAVEKISKDYIRVNLRLVAVIRSLFPLMVFLSNVSLGIILYVGGRQTIRGTITPGDFVAFISYLGLLTWPMMAMGWVTNLIQRGKASLERIDTILQQAPQIADPPAATEPHPPVRAIGSTGAAALNFAHVFFAYPGRQGQDPPPAVLSDIHLSVDAGRILGVVGPPGSGKTSLLALIPRIFDVTDGAVRIDGIDVRRMPLDRLRSAVAFVPQEPFLFAGTVRDNIVFDTPAVSRHDLDRALRRASLEEMIVTLEKGLDTVVGEKGVILSGGQKQRIALARALVKPSPILVLDDPISQVDAATGNAIVEDIRRTAPEQTIVIVSHRLSAVRFADTIITVDRGRIVETGTHNDLIAGDGYYARTFRLQAVEAQYDAA